MRRSSSVVACAALLSLTVVAAARSRAGDDKPAASAVEVVKIPTERGVTLEGSLHRPAKANACNAVAVVMAPGQTGGRDRPVPKRTSEALAAAGFPVVRFDWAYFSAKKQPSEDLATEAADLEAAVAFAKKQAGVSRVIVGGKSLGTLATAKHLAKAPDAAAALLLLTLPLEMGDPGATAFEGLEPLLRTKLPTLIVAGDHDPLCPLEKLYEFASKCDVKPRVVVVPGDHGLAKQRGDDSETEDNVGLCAAAAVLWARRFSGT